MQLIHEISVRQWSTQGSVKFPSSISIFCPYCRDKGIFLTSKHLDDTDRNTRSSTANCPGCKENVHFWTIKEKDEIKNFMYPEVENLYPTPQFLSDIPEPLQRAFISTVDSFNSQNYVATAVSARRTLEGIFKYLVSEYKDNDTLFKLIEKAKEEIDFSAPLTSLSHAIRDGGNLGAHFDMEKEPDHILAKQMIELLDYLISYLYVLPNEIKKLEHSLNKKSSKN